VVGGVTGQPEASAPKVKLKKTIIRARTASGTALPRMVRCGCCPLQSEIYGSASRIAGKPNNQFDFRFDGQMLF
jgi:hypothetical protein